MTLQIVAREEWGAQPPVQELEPIELPVKYVVVSQYPIARCKKRKDCLKRMQELQNDHVKNGHPDIGFNDVKLNILYEADCSFYIGGDGVVYEARGWRFIGTKRIHCRRNFAYRRLDIAYIGTYRKEYNENPPLKMTNALKELIEYGIEKNYILKKHKKVLCTTYRQEEGAFATDWLNTFYDY